MRATKLVLPLFLLAAYSPAQVLSPEEIRDPGMRELQKKYFERFQWPLGIGLLLFCLRGLSDRAAWSDKLLSPMFWSLNIGLAMMVFISLVPAGIYQAWASISKGMWFARSPEIVHSHWMETFVWMRVPGDVVFAVGCMFLALFAFRLLMGGKQKQAKLSPVGQTAKA